MDFAPEIRLRFRDGHKFLTQVFFLLFVLIIFLAITRACIYLYIRRSSFSQRGGGGGGGGGRGNRVVLPAPGRLNGRAQIISEQAAAAGDCSFGPTSELVLTRTATAICEATQRDAETATATTLEVLAFLRFYISFDLFLEIFSDYPNLVLDVIFGCAHIYWNLIQLLGFRKFSSFPFTFFPCLQRIENEGSIGFSSVLLMNSYQLYLLTFS